MTKKLTIGYLLLSMMVFSFALSFTLASSAYADSTCCFELCPFPSSQIAVKGHLVQGQCVYTGLPPCDTAVVECR